MKQKGFTLIELLAVIVVLAVIALIAIPIITNVIDKAKQGALKDSAYGILDTGEMYLAKNMKEGISDTLEFTCSNGKCVSGTEEIAYKGNIDSGKVRIYSDNKIELCITDNKNAALKRVSDKEITVSTGTCDYGELNYDVNALVSKDDFDKITKELNELQKKYDEIIDKGDATTDDIIKGKKAVVNGIEITGTREEKSMMLLGTFTGECQENYVLDVKTLLSNYELLTVDNFVITNNFSWHTSNGSIPGNGYVSFQAFSPTYSYDASSGQLTITVGGGFLDSPNNAYDQRIGNTGKIYYVN